METWTQNPIVIVALSFSSFFVGALLALPLVRYLRRLRAPVEPRVSPPPGPPAEPAPAQVSTSPSSSDDGLGSLLGLLVLFSLLGSSRRSSGARSER